MIQMPAQRPGNGIVDGASVIWRTSTRSMGNGNCVEVAQPGAGQVSIRDSKNRGGPALHFSSVAFESLVADIKDGKYRV